MPGPGTEKHCSRPLFDKYCKPEAKIRSPRNSLTKIMSHNPPHRYTRTLHTMFGHESLDFPKRKLSPTSKFHAPEWWRRTGSMGPISTRSNLTKFKLLSLGFESTSARVNISPPSLSVRTFRRVTVRSQAKGRQNRPGLPTHCTERILTASNRVTRKNVSDFYLIKNSRVSS
jgi:hypothetical protein